MVSLRHSRDATQPTTLLAPNRALSCDTASAEAILSVFTALGITLMRAGSKPHAVMTRLMTLEITPMRSILP
jgi:hypothetical protein